MEEIILSGIAVSGGIGIGPAVFIAHSEDEIPEIAISRKEVDTEIGRYRVALSQSRQDVERLRTMSLHEGSSEIVSILGTHLEMMQDPMMTTVIEDKIRHSQKNTEAVFHGLINEYKQRFSAIRDNHLRERLQDIRDVTNRVLGYLGAAKKQRLSEVPPGSVVVTHELVPSEAVEADVSAFVTASGGVSSHVAIIARAKGIPYVTGIDVKKCKKVSPQQLVVDGSKGLVILNPSAKTLKKYQALQQEEQAFYSKLKGKTKKKAETTDGCKVTLFANLDNPKELDGVTKNGASGVGLFRSEYLFLTTRRFPTEEEQFKIYKKMAVDLKGKPLVVRLFDIGGDKKIDLLPEEKDAKYFAKIGFESNPALGCRAVRFLLKFPEILEAQLRAILRASAFGAVQLLLPMVTDLGELWQVRALVAKMKSQLDASGVAYAKHLPIGCMIEVPSSALMADILAQEADFLSIGTNDLAQYTVAIDRNNPHTSELYFSTHPSVLRLIQTIAGAADRAKKPVIVCGEYAADPMLIPVLIGLGIRRFSVSGRNIPVVKHTVGQWSKADACRLAEGALAQVSSAQLKDFLTGQISG